MAHKTAGDDNAVLILEFETGCIAVAEESWTKLGGMDDRAEVYGSKGVAYADLLHGNAIETYSSAGYDYAVEKAGSTRGWTFAIYAEEWNYGFWDEMRHFVDCVADDRKPEVTGEDAVPYWKFCSPRTSRLERAAKWNCHFRRLPGSRSIFGSGAEQSVKATGQSAVLTHYRGINTLVLCRA